MGKYGVLLAVALAMVFGIEADSAWAKGGKKGGHKQGKGANLKTMFAKWDANSDGKVTRDEYVSALRARARKSGKTGNAAARFAKIDKDSDGSITLPELRKSMKQGKKRPAKRNGPAA